MFVRLQNIWLYKVNQSKYIVLFKRKINLFVIVIQLLTTRATLTEAKFKNLENTIQNGKYDRNVGNRETAVKTYRNKTKVILENWRI